jgi:hypothetical protein
MIKNQSLSFGNLWQTFIKGLHQDGLLADFFPLWQHWKRKAWGHLILSWVS